MMERVKVRKLKSPFFFFLEVSTSSVLQTQEGWKRHTSVTESTVLVLLSLTFEIPPRTSYIPSERRVYETSPGVPPPSYQGEERKG